jgi:hypothetical protein
VHHAQHGTRGGVDKYGDILWITTSIPLSEGSLLIAVTYRSPTPGISFVYPLLLFLREDDRVTLSLDSQHFGRTQVCKDCTMKLG